MHSQSTMQVYYKNNFFKKGVDKGDRFQYYEIVVILLPKGSNPFILMRQNGAKPHKNAGVAELADAQDLKS